MASLSELIKLTGRSNLQAVALGYGENSRVVRIVGMCENVSGVETTVKILGGNAIWNNEPSTFVIASTSPDDTLLGTGARTVNIIGIDSVGLSAAELMSLNGTTGVTTTKVFRTVNSANVMSAGAAETNIGNITIGTGAVVEGILAVPYLRIGSGLSRSMNMFRTVPIDYSAYVVYLNTTTADGQPNAYATFRLVLRRHGVRDTRAIYYMPSQNGMYIKQFVSPLAVSGDSAIELRAKVSSGTMKCTAEMGLLLVPAMNPL